MASVIVSNADGSINVDETLKKIDKGFAYVLEQLKKPKEDRLREFIFKNTEGKIQGVFIDLDNPICPICKEKMDPFTMSKEVKNENGTIKYPSTPRFYCKKDSVYFNFSNRNTKEW